MLEERLRSDLTLCMKAKQELEVTTVRMALSAIHLRIKDSGKIPSDQEIQALLQTMVKQRKDSIAQFTKGNRLDLVEREEKEIAILQVYLPREASDYELEDCLEIALVTAEDPRNIGQLIKAAKLAGESKGLSLDGKKLSERVKHLLSLK